MTEKQEKVAGLYIISTPLGNLEDITYRAVRILKESDLIFSEDTRKTAILLRQYQIDTPQRSYRIHRLARDTEEVLTHLKEGKMVSLCTDAGTPGISDPGSHLIRKVREELPNLPILPIPGPSALAAALSVSGFQANPSIFLGFLSPKSGRRINALSGYRNFEGNLVLYESVHRIRRLLHEILEIFPGRDLFVAREMTKYYEEYILIRSGEQNARGLIDAIPEKGEFTVIIGPER
jgi:16S rRNA (cytidine1402-2'-O)-methyltransferase